MALLVDGSVRCVVELQKYLTALGGGRAFTGKMEKGKENKYSCCVLAGFRSMQERLASLKVGRSLCSGSVVCS